LLGAAVTGALGVGVATRGELGAGALTLGRLNPLLEERVELLPLPSAGAVKRAMLSTDAASIERNVILEFIRNSAFVMIYDIIRRI